MNRRKLSIIILILLLNGISFATESQMSNEFTGYTYVGGGDYVNKFTGQFNYSIPIISIPGPGGSGYEMALTYTSGSGPESESSWVGFGWQLSPGAINRQVNGIPDDFNDIAVKSYQKFRAIYNVQSKAELNSEFRSNDDVKIPGKVKKESIKFSIGLNYSNISNFTTNLGYGANIGGASNKIDVSNSGDFSLGLTTDWGNKGIASDIASDIASSISGIYMFNQIFSLYKGGNFYANNIISLSPGISFPRVIPEYSVLVEKKSFKPHIAAYGARLEVGSSKLITSQLPIGNQPIIKKSFGQFYSGYNNDKEAISDFYLENDYSFNITDKFLPIPFKSTDKYIVSVQGLNGIFKTYSTKNGNFFRKNSTNIETKNMGGGLAIGVDIGFLHLNIGGDYYSDLGQNENVLNNTKIKNLNLKYNHDDNVDLNSNYLRRILPSVYFKFIHDLGGDRTFYDDNSLFNLSINDDYYNYNLKNNKMSEYADYIPMSKNIEFIRFKDINTIKTKYFNRAVYDNLIDYKDINDYMLMAFVIDSENGKRYEFGQPIFTRNNVNMSYGISKLRKSDVDIAEIYSHTEDNYRVYHSINPIHDKNNRDEEPHIMMGRELNEPYVSSYLLTNIYSNDYLDLNNDGPSNDDIGTYTEFNYYQSAGEKRKKNNIDIKWQKDYENSNTFTNWYKFRAPYNGFSYSKGSYSDLRDDMISYNSGEKELFYLNTVATKTHIAIFVTNQSSNTFVNANNNEEFELISNTANRKDNFEAIYNEYHAGSSSTVTSANSGTINKQKYLERIELWTIDAENPKDENGKYRLKEKLKTVRFKYDYSAWPNQISSLEEGETRLGKLTLKKVWTEYGQVKEKENSPYIFDYTKHTEDYEIYNAIELTNYNNTSPTLMDTPEYNYLNVNSWGDYEPDNLGGDDKKRFYINSSNHNGSMQFLKNGTPQIYDPSAWKLKKITLPSDGEIHVDYEQNEYSYVQDRPAMVMAYVKDGGYKPNSGKIILDMEKTLGLNYNTDQALMDSIMDKINVEIKETNKNDIFRKNKFNFKFLYGVLGSPGDIELGKSNLEYIEGWAQIKSCIIENDELVLQFEKKGDEFTPRVMCGQFFENKLNLLSYKKSDYDFNNDVTIGTNSYKEEYLTKGEVEAKVSSESLTSAFEFKNGSNGNVCRSIIEEYSYIRIPLPISIPKKGSGVRVKRMLFIDNFDELTKSHAPRIYGKEYIYNDKDNRSFGVVNNEPSRLEKENSLINTYIKKSNENETTYDIGTNSANFNYKENDIEQYDGIVGKSLIGMPSIEYSKIIVKDIYNISTQSGFEINEYFTSKDYPTNGRIGEDIYSFKYSNIDTKPIQRNFLKYSEKKVVSSQRYQHVIYNLAGKIKKISKYGGNYDNKEDDWILGYEKKVDYFDVLEKIPVLTSKFKIEETYPGIEVDLINYKEVHKTRSMIINPDLDIALQYPFFYPTDFSSNLFQIPIEYSNQELNLKVSNKIIEIAPFAKKITTFIDGVTNIEENIAFNKNTGNPIVKRVNNKFGNSLLNNEMYDIVDIPASYVYKELSQKSRGKIDDASLRTVYILNTSSTINRAGIYRRKFQKNGNDIYTLSFDPFWDNNAAENFIENFIDGTIIRVKTPKSNQQSSSSDEYYIVTKKLNDLLYLKPYLHESIGIEDDLPFSESLVSVDIIKSGFKNMLNLSLGQIIKKTTNTSIDNRILKNVNYVTNQLDTSRVLKQELVDSLNSKLNWLASKIIDTSLVLNDITGTSPIIEFNEVNVLENYYGSEEFTTDKTFKVYDINSDYKELSLQNIYDDNSLRIANLKLGTYDSKAPQYIKDEIGMLHFDLVYKRNGHLSIEESSTFHKLTLDIIDIIERAATLNLVNIITQLGIKDFTDISKKNINTLKQYIDEEIGYNDFQNNIYEFNTKLCTGDSLISIEYEIRDATLELIGNEENYEGIYINKFIINLGASDNSPFVKNENDINNIYRLIYEYSSSENIRFNVEKKSGSEWIASTSSINLTTLDYDNKEFLKAQDLFYINSSNKFCVKFNDNEMPYTTVDYEVTKTVLKDDECRRQISCIFPRMYPASISNNQLDISGSTFPSTSSNTMLNDLDVFKLIDGEIMVPSKNYIHIDEEDDEIITTLNNGMSENSIWCMNFYEDFKDVFYAENVLSVQATELSNTWTSYDLSSNTFLNSDNEYLNGALGRWNVKSNYSYRNNIENSKDYYRNSNIYDSSSVLEFNKSNEAVVGGNLAFDLKSAQKIKPEFVMFNWKVPYINDEYEWIYDKKNTSIDNNGIVTESIDFLNNKIASNYNELGQIIYECAYCENESIIFKDFEENSASFSHTGNSSTTINMQFSEFGEISLEENKNYIVEFWFNLNSSFQTNLSFGHSSATQTINSIGNDEQIRTGEWTLIKVEFTANLTGSHTFYMQSSSGGANGIRIDDLLVKPKDAVIKKYVYDKDNYQLLSELDNEHFASYYKYDFQNRLSEIYKETYKGVKLLKQTSYNQPKELVYSFSGGGSTYQMMNNETNQFENKVKNINVLDGNKKYNLKPRINPNMLPNPRLPEKENEFDNKFDIFDFELNKDGMEYRFFNVPLDSIKKLKHEYDRLDSLSKLDSLPGFNINSALKNKMKEELHLKESLKSTKIKEIDIEKYDIEDLPNINMDSLKIDKSILNDSLNIILESEKEKQLNRKVEVNKEVRK